METVNNRKNIYRILAIEILLVIAIVSALLGEAIVNAINHKNAYDEIIYEKVSEIQGTICETNSEAAIELQKMILNSENAWYDEDEEKWVIACTVYTNKVVDESFVRGALGLEVGQNYGISDYLIFGVIDDYEYYVNNLDDNGVDEWNVTVWSDVSPEDQQLIISTAQTIADKAVGSDAEKVRIITKEIDEMLTYEIIDGNNLATVIRTGKGCCRHYANLFSLVCTYAGIDSRIVGGNSDNEGHAWNIVEVDGRWYHVDPTWEDEENEKWVLLGSGTIMETRELLPEYEVINEIYDISEEDYAA